MTKVPNWRLRIAKLRRLDKDGKLDDLTHARLTEPAQYWATCAVAEVSGGVLALGGPPRGYKMHNLGHDFTVALSCRDWDAALMIREQIADLWESGVY